jgi:hypothetical protein
MLDVYATFAEDWMAVPCSRGSRSEKEKFAGRVRTYAIEALMQDNRALQAGPRTTWDRTSPRPSISSSRTRRRLAARLEHLLGRLHAPGGGRGHGARRSTTAWCCRRAWRPSRSPSSPSGRAAIPRRRSCPRPGTSGTDWSLPAIPSRSTIGKPLPGFKFNEWEMLGVPLRIEIGPKDLEKGSVMTVRRHDRGKQPVPWTPSPTASGSYWTRCSGRSSRPRGRAATPATRLVDTYDDLKATVEGPGGFVLAPWCGSTACEVKVQDETKATIRILAFDQPESPVAASSVVSPRASASISPRPTELRGAPSRRPDRAWPGAPRPRRPEARGGLEVGHAAPCWLWTAATPLPAGSDGRSGRGADPHGERSGPGGVHHVRHAGGSLRSPRRHSCRHEIVGGARRASHGISGTARSSCGARGMRSPRCVGCAIPAGCSTPPAPPDAAWRGLQAAEVADVPAAAFWIGVPAHHLPPETPPLERRRLAVEEATELRVHVSSRMRGLCLLAGCLLLFLIPQLAPLVGNGEWRGGPTRVDLSGPPGLGWAGEPCVWRNSR